MGPNKFSLNLLPNSMVTIELDAKGKILGRLSTQIATMLRGKDTPQYRRDRLADVKVIVKNANKYKVSGKKMAQKKYYNFSGYPGGLKTITMDKLLVKHPERALELAVKRMLPDNKLRKQMMKHLILETE